MSIYECENDGYKYIFTLIDSFSKFAFVFPSIRRDSFSFSKILEKLFYSEGPWKIFHSDNGKEFVNARVKLILSRFGVEERHGRPYHPQSQGQIERFNKTLKMKIRKSLNSNSRRYIDKIDEIMYQYNTVKRRATNISPFLLYRGYDPLSLKPVDYIFEQRDARLRHINYVEGFKNEYNARTSVQNILPDSRVLIAKIFNPSTIRRGGALENYYLGSCKKYCPIK